MKRRNFIQKTGAAAAALSAGELTHASDEKNQPNVIIVHCDELNFRTLGCYRDTLSEEQAFMWGKKAVCETPHIDSLAKDGALCTSFYAATPVCSPSRSSWISGKYPQNTPVTNNNVHLSDEVVTFAHQLNKAGYKTGYAGKWHLDGNGKPQWEPQRKFGFTDNRFMFNRGHWKKFGFTENGEPEVAAKDRKGNPGYGVDGADEKSFATDWLMDRTIDFIDKHKADPFAYMVSIPDPHGPDTVRAPYDTMFSDDEVEKPRTYAKDRATAPSWGMPAQKCPWKMASYHGMIKCIDDNVGKLIAALKERDLYDRTIVIFTADHGDMRGEHGLQNKGYPMEASAKIPFVIRWPEGIEAGQTVRRAMNTTDFCSTILSLTGAEPTGFEEGQNMAPAFQGEEMKSVDVTFSRSTTQSAESNTGWIAAVSPTHKLILSDKDKPWLIDLVSDPDEMTNVVDDPRQKEIAKFLATQLHAYGTRCKDPKIDHPNTAEGLSQLMA